MPVSNYAVFITQDGLGLPTPASYINHTVADSPVLAAYLTFATQALSLLGFNSTQAAQGAAAALAFETSLANIFTPDVIFFLFLFAYLILVEIHLRLFRFVSFHLLPSDTLNLSFPPLTRTQDDLLDPATIYHKMTLAELAALAPAFNWAQYFARAGVTSPPLETVVVYTPDYLAKLSSLLQATSPETLVVCLRPVMFFEARV